MSVTHFFKGASAVKSRFRKSSDLRASRSALVIPFGFRFGLWIRCICSIILRTVPSLGMVTFHKLADFILILKCLKHADSAVICVFFVRSMDLQHRICQRLILPWFLFAFQIIIESLSADLQSFAVKADFSGVFAVIGSICNIFQSLLFPDF